MNKSDQSALFLRNAALDVAKSLRNQAEYLRAKASTMESYADRLEFEAKGVKGSFDDDDD